MNHSLKSFLIVIVAVANMMTASAQKKKNVILFLVDDMGWMDAGTYGSTFYETPNIDKLAKEGMKFTNAYAASPVCSPTRASIMTGKYPVTTQTTDWFGAPQPEEAEKSKAFAKKPLLPAPYKEYLPLEEKTIAEAFKEAGYKTIIAGKWHLGEDPRFYPEHQGFDINKGGYFKGHPDSYFSPYTNPRLSDGPPGEYLGDRLAAETIDFINKNKQTPFFVYFPFYEVHTPLQAKDSLIKKYKEKREKLGLKDEVEMEGKLKFRGNQSLPVYAAMVETMDAIIGDILKKVKEAGLEDNTIIVFTSDNGGLSTAEGSPTSNTPLRAGKGWLYEGGIREPFIIKSKDQIKPGSINHSLIISNDIYPTMLKMCGLPLQPTQHTGGVDISPLFAGKKLDRDALYWHYPHYGNQGGFPGAAIRKGDWKLIRSFEKDEYELYNLNNDIGEKNNLVAKYPEKVAELKKQLSNWLREQNAKFPIKNNGDSKLQPDTSYLSGIRETLRQRWPNNRMVNLVFHGHSVPAGYFRGGVLNQKQSYPQILSDCLAIRFPTVPINCIRTAIGGEQSEQGARRFDSTVLNHLPDVLFIDYGLNDRNIGLERSAAAWTRMIEKALARNIKVVLLTPSPDLKEDITSDDTPLSQHAAQIRTLGKKYGLPVIDSYERFRSLQLEGEDLKKYMSQNNHPNDVGHTIVAKELLQLF